MRQDTFFYRPQASLPFPVTIITGTCRSGKTLLGNALASHANVEYADEPWTAMLLPMIVRAGKVEPEFAKGWLSAFVSELFNDLVLLRQANFRPSDLSSIWTKKTPDEILRRVSGLQSRDDVRSLTREKNLSLLMTLAECGSFVDLLAEAIPEVRFVHVVRNGFDVATDVAEKRWLCDDQLKSPTNAQLFARFRDGSTEYHLPWWVDEGDERRFVELSLYERGLYYWCSLIEKTLALTDRVEMQLVRYAEMVRRPDQQVRRIASALGYVSGPLTISCLSEISPRTRKPPPSSLDTLLYEQTVRYNQTLDIKDD